jgi:eukaryotic-like serine/threonine-protein kinase
MIGQDSVAASTLAARRACDELSRRLRSGLACGAEEFLAADPTIGSDTDSVLELLYTEFIVREQLGERPQTQLWLDRFPRWRAELAQLFEVHTLVDVEQASRAGMSGTDPETGGAKPSDDRLGADCEHGLFLAGYDILQEIGRGGMGVVYQARQRGLGRIVALKMMLPPLGTRERARFRAEAEATARLSHPNIVQIYEVGEEEDRPFLSMEYVAGKSLDQRLAGSPLAPRAAAELLRTLAVAVAYAHDQGIVHRDLKPANIVLACDGSPKITDFGLARQLSPPGSAPEPSHDGPPSVAVVGTPSYMAPEQCGGGSHAGAAADVYALGAILYEALTGRPPFRGETALDILELVRSQEPVPPSRLAPKAPSDLETICLKCLEKQPQQRYAGAAALADDLHRFLQGAPILARPVGRTERAVRWCRRKPAIAALAGGIALAVVCGTAASASLAVWALQEKGRADQRTRQVLAARELADHHFSQAEKAVEEYLDGIEDNDRLKEADFLDLRKRLLSSAVPFYEDFVKARPASAELDAKRGRAYERLASVRRHLGDRERASAEYRQALDIFQRLASDRPDVPEHRRLEARCRYGLASILFDLGRRPEAEIEQRQALALQRLLVAAAPDNPAYRSDLAASHHMLGYMLKAAGKAAEAEAEYNRAIALRQDLAAEFPTVARHRTDLADSHANLGTVFGVLGRRAEEAAEYRKALPLQDRLAAEFPNVPNHRQSLARTHTNLGVLLGQLRQRPEAEAEYREALRIQRLLAADFPTMPEYRRSVATNLFNIGTLLTAMGKPSEAAVEYREALQLQRQLVEQFPDVIDYRSQLARTLHNLALGLYREGKNDEARGLFEQAVEQQLHASRAVPGNPTYTELLRGHYRSLSDSYLRLKDHAKAVEAAGHFVQCRSDAAGDPYWAARVLGRCATLAEQEPALPETRRKELAQAYADQAVDYLREAIRRGFSEVRPLKTSGAFAALRDRADFQQLIKDLERR